MSGVGYGIRGGTFARSIGSLMLCVLPAGLAAQTPSPAVEGAATAFPDSATRALHAAARSAQSRIERSVLAYTALVKQRGGVDLRLPIRDRTLYRVENASRVFWSRDGDVVVQVLGGRELQPGANEARPDRSGSRETFFNPGSSGDRLTFGLVEEDDDDVWFQHPLGPNAEQFYTFRTGGQVALSLPDRRQLRVVELQVIPRIADARRISGSLWIEPESGSLVRAVYGMATPADMLVEIENDGDDVWIPGLFKPMTAQITLVTVEYGLWDFRVWLPSSMRIEGIAQAGIIKAPAAMEMSYLLESVTLEGDLAQAPGDSTAALPAGVLEQKHFRTRSEAMAYLGTLMGETEGDAFRSGGDRTRRRVNGQTTRVFLPRDPQALLDSPELPPPIWEDAPGFATEAQIADWLGLLDDLPLPQVAGPRWAFNWGTQRPDLLRYNRVEALAVGARAEVLVPSPAGPLFLRLQPFLGVADLEPKVRFTIDRESLRRKLSIGVYHELDPVSREGRYLGIGNSASAFFFGRDDGDYFMATGFDLRVTPPSAERTSYELRLYAEHQSPVGVNTSFSLNNAFDGDWQFRPNVEADRVDELGASLLLVPSWGTDPLAPQAGAELFLQAATGDSVYSRASLGLRGSLPLFGNRLSIGALAAVGQSWGHPTIQRNWFLGGAHTLRGYEAATLVGPSYARGTIELVRRFRGVGLSVFSDGGWVGENLNDFDQPEALYSIGAGISLMEGIIRFDLARGMRDPQGWRLHLYLDGIL